MTHEAAKFVVSMTQEELQFCVKGVGALGMVWNKQAREETKAARDVLITKLAEILHSRNRENEEERVS